MRPGCNSSVPRRGPDSPYELVRLSGPRCARCREGCRELYRCPLRRRLSSTRHFRPTAIRRADPRLRHAAGSQVYSAAPESFRQQAIAGWWLLAARPRGGAEASRQAWLERNARPEQRASQRSHFHFAGAQQARERQSRQEASVAQVGSQFGRGEQMASEELREPEQRSPERPAQDRAESSTQTQAAKEPWGPASHPGRYGGQVGSAARGVREHSEPGVLPYQLAQAQGNSLKAR